jgi:hypothetical protein
MKMPIAYLDVAARYVELAPHLIFRTPTVANLGSPVGLYLEQPWVGLTEEESDNLFVEAQRQMTGSSSRECIHIFRQLVETKLKEKNT